jgi:hypothetical protein
VGCRAVKIKNVSELPPHMRARAAAALELQGIVDIAAGGRTKYGNRRIKIEGMRSFDSELEFRCYEWLVARRELGEILWFTRQVPFELEGGVVYRLDYLAALAAGPPFAEYWDAKGKDTQASINKRKQVKARFGLDVKLWPQGAGLLPSQRGSAA